MSESIARGRGRTKNTCRKCGRTVYVVLINGQKVETDPELINVVAHDQPVAVLARRVHGEMCMRYELEAAKKKALIEARRTNRNT